MLGKVGDATQYETHDPTICLTWYDYGAAVWAVTRQLSFPSIAALAKEREAHYHDVLSGDHTVRQLTQEVQQAASKSSRGAPSIQSTIVYALSLIGVEELIWAPAEVEHALKLLSCPNFLSGYATVEDRGVRPDRRVDHSGISQQENDFLRLGAPFLDGKAFNFARTVRGYASWAGVAFHLPPAERGVFECEFISYETRLQALWLFLDHHTKLLDQGMIRAIDPKTKHHVHTQSRHVFSAGPTETTPLRLFKEAVVATSRIEQLWETFQRHL
jgi:hypothetical protein